ncbi:MAG: sulfatase-like hydrolase/transferase, partial [Victivallales bacterium]|nr:sulfatase-like hydrolase/transferase [Victivallales bacterium]
NQSKTDYQFNSPPTAWDPGKGWQGRQPGQPFFAIINLGTTHEGQIRNPKRRQQLDRDLSPKELHDPAKAPIPPYQPDTPVVRRDWAQYHDLITLMDREVGRILDQLRTDGLAEDTIVWFWGDHGRGLPRGKRWIYDSGLRFPLVIHVPEKYREWARIADPGSEKGLVSFVDFAPTMLSLAGVPVPGAMQGQPFLGPQKAKSRTYIYAARDRVDEAVDMVRAIGDGRYKYLRNFLAHLPRSVQIDYMDKMPSMQEMRRLHAEGKLTGAQLQYFECPRPVEELYDTTTDPHEVRNLANDPTHAATLARLREALFAWMRDTGDFGLLPEPMFDALKRPGDKKRTTPTPGFTLEPGDPGLLALSCPEPGASLRYRIDQRAPEQRPRGIRLSYRAAKVHGKGLKKTPDRGIIGWRDVKTWLSWEVRIPRAGRVPIHVIAACQGRGGSPYKLTVGEAVLEGVVQNTKGWYTHQPFQVGEVDIPQPGTYTVSLKPQPQDRTYSMNLLEVVVDGANLGAAERLPWQLYSAPVPVQKGCTIWAQACRLGYNNSQIVEWTFGAPLPEPHPYEATPHWRVALPPTRVAAILDLKALDGAGDRAMPAYQTALASPDPALRYWALLGLHTACYGTAKDLGNNALLPRFRALLRDPSASVRIAAAQAIGQRGEADRALPVLLRELKENPLASGQLYAATAIHQLGQAASPAFPELRALRPSLKGYPARMLKHIVRD